MLVDEYILSFSIFSFLQYRQMFDRLTLMCQNLNNDISMNTLISFSHISLDGFVCGPQGEMDWIIINEELFAHVEKRIALTNAAMYGRVTYDLMEGYWPTAADQPNASRHDKAHSAWYKTSHKYVLSRSMQGVEKENTTIISDNIAERVNEIKNAAGDSEIMVFGSPRATHALMELGLIDGYWLFVNPIIVGEGIPLFKNIKEHTKLKMVASKQFECGVVEMSLIRK